MLQEIVEAFKNNDLKRYQCARYPQIQDGEWLVIAHEDFTGVDFGVFSLGYTIFKECSLNGARHLHGVPLVIEESTATDFDLRGIHTVIEARDSDFSGLLYNDDTMLAEPTNGQAGHSVFTNCKFDSTTREHFKAQGVIFREYTFS